MAHVKSMTAFGQHRSTSPDCVMEVDIQSVNRKHLDVRVHCTPELRRFEHLIQKWIAARISRGQVTLRITVKFEKESPLKLDANLPLAREIKEAADVLIREFGLNDSKFLSRLLCRNDQLLVVQEDWAQEEVYLEQLKTSVHGALDQLIEMKKSEGDALYRDFTARIKILDSVLEKIEIASIDTVELRREKLKEIIGLAVEDETLLREIAIYADKVDIQEEITRFRSHLVQFSHLLNEAGPHGKKMEFILQELNREANTVASKSPEIDVKHLTIQAKTEIERMREQLQNIE